MEKYKSQYPTLKQAKTKWSSPKDPYTAAHLAWARKAKDFQHTNAREKLTASSVLARMIAAAQQRQQRIVHEETSEDHIYHVTHTKHVAKIQKQGIMPMKTSNWVKAGDKERYGGGEVYAFTHKDDAHKWAGRMDWAHNQKLGSGKISIITAKRPTDRKFERDENDPLSQAGRKGDWLKTHGSIEPHHIVSVEPYMPRKLGEDRIGKPTPSAEEIAKKHNKEVAEIQAQIDKGIKVEREHTNSDEEAHEIARDHLDEFPDYYDRLDKMEKKAKKDMKEEFIKEDKGEGNVSNTRGVLHELLTGYHLRGGSHMEKHPDVNGDSPKQAHDKLKAKVSPDEYKAINHRAKAAASDIAARVGKHGNIHDVHWTSKHGDIHRSTGIHATQDEDQSDIVVHTKHPKTGKTTHHGVSLKVTDSKAHVPVSNLGLSHTPGAAAHLDKHRKEVFSKFPALGKMTSSDERKKYVREHPKVRDTIRKMNTETMSKVVKTAAKHLSSMKTEDIANHVRHHILRANPTPMQKQGHTHMRHTTHGAAGGNYSFSAIDPSKDHEHILKNHKHLTVHASGTSVIFSHKGTPFARHRIKFTSQSDPKSTLKGSGEMIGKSAVRSVNEGYDPDVEQTRNRIEAHKKVAEKMAQTHGENSQEASFHRAYVKHMQKQLKDVHGLDEMMGVGSGAVAGMPTTSPPDETPVRGPILRRKKFAGKTVFVVKPETFYKSYLGKRKYEHYEKFLEGCEGFEEIRDFGRKHWDEPIILEDETTGAMVYLKYGRK